MPAFRFEPSSSLLAQYHPIPWISQRALRLRKEEKQLEMHSLQMFLGSESITKSRGIKGFLSMGEQAQWEYGMTSWPRQKGKAQRDTTQSAKLNMNLGLSTDF